MTLQTLLENKVKAAVHSIFNVDLASVEFQATRKEFAGDITVVVFPMLRVIKGNPVAIGEQIGAYLVDHVEEVTAFNVVKGFLNLEISDTYYLELFNEIKGDVSYGFSDTTSDKAVMVEYSSPNTNKPLHLGHIRNVLLGYSVAEILKASGKKVYKTQIINDRGIHICKSMLAWQRYGNGETPESTGIKGDKLVGNYYVLFEMKLREQAEPIFYNYRNDIIDPPTISATKIKASNEIIRNHEIRKKEELNKLNFNLISKIGDEFTERLETAIENDLLIKSISRVIIAATDDERRKEVKRKIVEFEKIVKPIIDIENKISEEVSKIHKIARDRTEVMGKAQEMLRQWEAGDEDVVSLWEMMNQWVYDGFEETYKTIGVDFDAYYYESNTYLLGKEFIAEGLKTGVFNKKEDGSVWCDLTEDGLDEKIVLRADGTAVYMTQDIGTAIQRIKDYPDVGGMVYTVGNEQDYHFNVLFLILKKLGFDWAENLHHLSYGMVDLPDGKMKSREGTVVDADDLVAEMVKTAAEISKEKGKLDGYNENEKNEIFKIIGLGALKYQILKVDPKKRILFDPKESIDFNGDSGPFVQMIYVRTRAILRKANLNWRNRTIINISLHKKEIELIKLILNFEDVINNAAEQYNPSLIINYLYSLAKEYSSYYQEVPILVAEDDNERTFRIQLSNTVGQTIKNAFSVLGISVPERM